MFHIIRIRNWKLTLISIAGFLLFLTVCLVMLRTAPRDSVTVGGEQIGLRIRNDGDIEAFVEKCGCEIEGCVSDEEITVPKTWNDTYEAYNKIQTEQGFDLRRYKGRTVRKLVFAVRDSDRYVTVLATDQYIIAADICGAQQGSVPQPLVVG